MDNNHVPDNTSQDNFDFRSIGNNFEFYSADDIPITYMEEDTNSTESDMTSVCTINHKPEIELNEIRNNLFFDAPKNYSPVKRSRNTTEVNGELSQLNWKRMTPIPTIPTFQTHADLDDIPSILKEETVYNTRSDSGNSNISEPKSPFTTSTIGFFGNNYFNDGTGPLRNTAEEVKRSNDKNEIINGPVNNLKRDRPGTESSVLNLSIKKRQKIVHHNF